MRMLCSRLFCRVTAIAALTGFLVSPSRTMAQDDPWIIVDTALTSVTYLGASYPVFVTKSFKVQYPTAAAIPQGADLKAHVFYVPASVLIELSDFTEAYKNRFKDGTLSVMVFQVAFIDDLIRQKVADAINAQFGTSVSKEQIQRMPTSRLTVQMKRAGEVITLASETQTIQKRDAVQIRLEGTEEQLEAIAGDPEKRPPHIWVTYDVSGAKISQNIVLVAISKLIDLRFHYYLSGQAAQRIFEEKGIRGNATDVLKPFEQSEGTNHSAGTFNANFDGWVTRDQIKRVFHRACEVMVESHIFDWPESDAERKHKTDQMVARSIERAVKTEDHMIGFQPDGKGGLALIDRDFAPNQIKSLESMMREANGRKLSRDKLDKEEQDKQKRETAEKLTHESQGEVTWELKDDVGLIVPKSVRVYYFDKSSFEQTLTSIRAETRATPAELRERYSGVTFTKSFPEVTKNLVLRQSERITARDNPDPKDGIGSYGRDVEIDTGGGPTHAEARPKVSYSSDGIQVDFYFVALEDHVNRTEFRGRKVFVYPKPKEVEVNGKLLPVIKIIRIEERRQLEVDATFNGGLDEIHLNGGGTWHVKQGVVKRKLADTNSAGTYFEEKFHLLIDGPGEDDRPYVGYDFTINVPYTVLVKAAHKEYLMAGQWLE
jgi:hypothetical protein